MAIVSSHRYGIEVIRRRSDLVDIIEVHRLRRMRLIDTPDTTVRPKIAAVLRKRSSAPRQIKQRFTKNLSCKIVSPARSNIYRNHDQLPAVAPKSHSRFERDRRRTPCCGIAPQPGSRLSTVTMSSPRQKSDDRVAADEPEPAGDNDAARTSSKEVHNRSLERRNVCHGVSAVNTISSVEVAKSRARLFEDQLNRREIPFLRVRF